MGYFRHFAIVTLRECKASAALGAAALEHIAACLGSNPCPKPVRPSTMTSVWLVSSFWHIIAIIRDCPRSFNFSLAWWILCSEQPRHKHSQIVYPHLFASYPHFNRGNTFLWKNSTPVALLVLDPLLYFSRLWKSRFFLILKGVIV